MVGGFQHVGPQVFSRLNQLTLGFRLDISGKEESVIHVGDLQDDGAIIALGPWIFFTHHSLMGWVEYLHLYPIDPSGR